MDVVRGVAIGVIAASLLGLLIFAAFLFPTVADNYRARTRQSIEMTVCIPLIERDLAKIATNAQASENLLREIRDEQRQSATKLDSVVERIRKG
jgi:hypothetical protein